MSSPEITVSFADVVAGRAYLRIPFVGKLLLAHWAGAPWSDKDTGACLSALQAEVLTRRERVRIVHGGSGLGKSALGGVELILANMLPFRKVAVVADRYDHVSHEFQYLYQGFKKLFSGHGEAFKRLVYRHQHNYHEYDSDSIWGTRTIGVSVQSDEGAALLGREFTDAVVGEASHISPEIYSARLLRALDRSMMNRSHGGDQEVGGVTMFTTPREFSGCSASEWERVKKSTGNKPELLHRDRVGWARSIWLREAAVIENPGYSKDVFEARRAEAGDSLAKRRVFEEQYLGKMTFASGRVWQSFGEDHHVKPMPSPEYIRSMRLGLSIDTGACTGMLLGGIGRDGKKWALGEVYLEKPPGGIYAVMEEAEAMLLRVLQPAFGHVSVKQVFDEILYLVSIDPASQHKLEIIDRWDTALTSPNTADQRSLIQTIDRVDQWFREDLLYIAEDCESLIDQIRKYIWKQTKSAGAHAALIREPSKVYDHMCDALRFLFIPLSEYGVPTDPPPAIDFADAWERQVKDSMFAPLRQAMADGARRNGQ